MLTSLVTGIFLWLIYTQYTVYINIVNLNLTICFSKLMKILIWRFINRRLRPRGLINSAKYHIDAEYDRGFNDDIGGGGDDGDCIHRVAPQIDLGHDRWWKGPSTFPLLLRNFFSPNTRKMGRIPDTFLTIHKNSIVILHPYHPPSSPSITHLSKSVDLCWKYLSSFTILHYVPLCSSQIKKN